MITCSNGVEEQEDELLKKERDDDTIDGAAMNVLVDLGSFVGEVDVIAVHAVLHDHVEQAERSDEWTNDGKRHGERENQQHPAVVDAEHELV